MKTVDTSVNISLKHAATEKRLSAIIKSGETDEKYLAHIFALFTDVPNIIPITNRKRSLPLNEQARGMASSLQPSSFSETRADEISS